MGDHTFHFRREVIEVHLLVWAPIQRYSQVLKRILYQDTLLVNLEPGLWRPSRSVDL